jgi:hypothetical protein
MIHISRTELRNLAEIYILANTPYSLLKSLKSHPLVERLFKDCTVEELKKYYDYVTARARRDEIVMALAYSTLIALLLKFNTSAQFSMLDIDSARLPWGDEIRRRIEFITASSSVITIESTPKPKVRIQYDTD